MTKYEFLQELEDCLRGEVSDYERTDSVNYYNSYIEDQASAGRSEEEILAELGSPRLLARSIIDAHGLQTVNDQTAGSSGSSYSGDYSDPSDDPFPNIRRTEELTPLERAGRIVVFAAVALLAFAILRIIALPLIFVIVGVMIYNRLIR